LIKLVAAVAAGLAATLGSAAGGHLSSSSHYVPDGQVSEFAIGGTRTVHTFRVGRLPTDITVAPDGKFVYTTNFLSETVSAVSASARPALVRSMHVDGRPMGLAVTPDSKLLLVSLEFGPGRGYGGLVLIIRTSDFKVVRSLAMDEPGQIVVAPNGKTAYAISVDPLADIVTPILTATGRAEKPIVVTRALWYQAYAIAMTRNGRFLYVLSTWNDHTILTPTRLSTRKALKPIKIGPQPAGMVITPNGRTLYVIANNGVTPILTATNRAGRPIRVGVGPGAMVVTPNSKWLYVTNAENDVYAINTATSKAGNPIFFGYDSYALVDGRGALAVSPDGKTVYVSAFSPDNGRPGAVLPIQTATNSIGSPIVVGPDPIMVAIDPQGDSGYVLDQVPAP
jgi:DNA-binding beta-propeller fold protein YncE